MKGKVLIGVAVVVVIAVAVAFVARSGRSREWTTASPEALAEFLKGLDSLQKVYVNEASRHFGKAVELDPSFVVAKRFLIVTKQLPSSDPMITSLYSDLEKADLSRLTPRERFLVEYTLAGHGKDPAKAQKLLEEFAATYPDDSFCLEILANVAASRQDWPESRRILSRLIEVAPNRVMAYNQLGYLEMGQARFAESEKMFQTYRYIAPDQANPHDSLAELYILIGRYDDATRELEEALRIRPDFCASYQHLAGLALMQARPQEARQALERAEKAGACQAYMIKALGCDLAVWPPFLASDWPAVWKAQQASCSAGDEGGDDVLRVWAALATGRRAEAEKVVEKARERLAKLSPATPGRKNQEAVVAHMEGVLLLSAGKASEAAERFRFADERMSFREISNGIFKLVNSKVLAQALQAAGDEQEAKAVLDRARAVNPKFMDLIAALAMPVSTS